MKYVTLNTRQVGQRVSRGTLPEFSKDGKVVCPSGHWLGDTESLRFWEKGMETVCGRKPHKGQRVAAIARYPALGIQIDTRL